MFSQPAELRFEHWKIIDQDLEERLERLRKDCANLSGDKLDRAHAFELAATDLFVEKAQIHLTLRVHKYSWAGVFFSALALGMIGFTIRFIIDHNPITDYMPWSHVVLIALKSAALAGFAGAGIYFAGSLSRAFFHEATTLYNRRHALRFGRMFVYLRYGISKTDRERILNELRRRYPSGQAVAGPGQPEHAPPPQMPIADALVAHLYGSVTAEELERAFGWNLETYTGFRDMKPEKMSANVYSKTIEVMSKLIESLGKLKSGGGSDRH